VVAYVVAIVFFAFIFDFSNGFHDSANSIATIVGTRVLSPLAAVVWAAVFNFAAAFTGSLAVAKAIGGGMIEQSVVNPNVIFAGLLGAITWNVITWAFGIPSSSSHALIGGYAGAAMGRAGLVAITWGSKWVLTLSFIVISPLLGMLAGYLLMVIVFWLFHLTSASRVDRFFRPAQLFSSALLSYSQGGNDAQKTMGIIVGLLVTAQSLFANQTGWLHHFYLADNNTIPRWIEIGAYSAIRSHAFRGWRIVYGSRITKLRPVGGFCDRRRRCHPSPPILASLSAQRTRHGSTLVLATQRVGGARGTRTDVGVLTIPAPGSWLPSRITSWSHCALPSPRDPPFAPALARNGVLGVTHL
jgi:PiT family inorganic phosphate transporter